MHFWYIKYIYFFFPTILSSIDFSTGQVENKMQDVMVSICYLRLFQICIRWLSSAIITLLHKIIEPNSECKPIQGWLCKNTYFLGGYQINSALKQFPYTLFLQIFHVKSPVREVKCFQINPTESLETNWFIYETNEIIIPYEHIVWVF